MNGFDTPSWAQVLRRAIDQGIVSAAQADRLTELFQNHQQQDFSTGLINFIRSGFSLTNVLNCAGGLTAISSAPLLMATGWEYFQGKGLLAISGVYGALGLVTTHYLAKRNQYIGAGLAGAFVVSLVPIATFALQEMTGLLGLPPYASATDPNLASLFNLEPGSHEMRYFTMEVTTLVTGCLMLLYFKLPFLSLPIALSLFYTVMDIFEASYGEIHRYNESEVARRDRIREIVIYLLSGTFIVFARILEKLIIPRLTGHPLGSGLNHDYSLWFYVVGTVPLLVEKFQDRPSKIGWICSLLISGILAGLGVVWERNVVTGLSTTSLLVELSLPQIGPDLSLASLSALFSSMLLVLGPMVNNKYLTVTSGLQMWAYLVKLSGDFFINSLLFPIALTGLGFGLIGAGYKMSSYERMMRSPVVSAFFSSIKQWCQRYI